MGEITRRFVFDTDKIFFISNGILMSQDITEFMEHHDYWSEELVKTGDNVGWNTPDTFLMIVDGDRIFRVSAEMYNRMLEDNDVHAKKMYMDGSVELIYSGTKFSNEFLKASSEYKRERPLWCGSSIMYKMAAAELDNGKRRRRLILLRNTICTVHNGNLTMVPDSWFMAAHGDDWEDVVKNSDEHLGYIRKDTYALLVSDNCIQRISREKACKLLDDFNTTSLSISTNEFHHYEVEYNASLFTDEYLEATTTYK